MGCLNAGRRQSAQSAGLGMTAELQLNMCGTRFARIWEYGPVNGAGGSCSFALRQRVSQLRTLCQSNCSKSQCVNRLYVPPKFGIGGEKKLGKARVAKRTVCPTRCSPIAKGMYG